MELCDRYADDMMLLMFAGAGWCLFFGSGLTVFIVRAYNMVFIVKLYVIM